MIVHPEFDARFSKANVTAHLQSMITALNTQILTLELGSEAKARAVGARQAVSSVAAWLRDHHRVNKARFRQYLAERANDENSRCIRVGHTFSLVAGCPRIAGFTLSLGSDQVEGHGYALNEMYGRYITFEHLLDVFV